MIELSPVVVEQGNAIVITKIIIATVPPIPDPIKIFLCDEMFVFGFAGSVIMITYVLLTYKVKINHRIQQCSSFFLHHC